VKAKKFKQFVTESIKRRSADISVEIDECVFVINDTIYFMTVAIDATLEYEPADSSVGLSESTSVSEYWLDDITFCEKFTDPEINQQVINSINTKIEKVSRLHKLGLNSENNPNTSDILWASLNKYPMEEVPEPELAQVKSILGKQIDDSNYRNLAYQDLTGNFEKQVMRALDYEIDKKDNGRW
jgi:hypothetical protein